jgi:hypothetical protein
MVFWLIGASLFTSAIGGSGVNCGQVGFAPVVYFGTHFPRSSPGIPNCHFVNIVNTTMAFAWINWFAQARLPALQTVNVLSGPSSRSRSFWPSPSPASDTNMIVSGRNLPKTKWVPLPQGPFPILPLEAMQPQLSNDVSSSDPRISQQRWVLEGSILVLCLKPCVFRDH